MFTVTLEVTWARHGAPFTDNRYSRAHRWSFDGGAEVRASASPHVVPAPMADPSGVDPEEAFVASIASCHMLWFLSIAAKRGLIVETYEDHPVGHLEEDEQGRLLVSRVTLRPTIRFLGPNAPAEEDVRIIHHESHERCFIANSVRTRIAVE